MIEGHRLNKMNVPHLSIFLLPENLDILRRRAEARGGITKEMIDQRLEIAEQEITQSKDYDYQIVNYEGRLSETVAKVAEIIRNALITQEDLDVGLTKNGL